MKRNFGFVIIALVLSVSMAACGGGGGAAAGKPEDAAKAMIDALFSGKDISPMVCASAKGQVDQMKTALSSIAGAGATIDTSGLTYTASNVSGDTATVTVAGNMKITVGGNSTTSAFPSAPMTLKNENGWKVCG